MTKLEEEIERAIGNRCDLHSHELFNAREAAVGIAKRWIEIALNKGEEIGQSNMSAIYNEYDEDNANEEKKEWLKEIELL